MSGIAGLWRTGGQAADLEELEGMLDAMAHRGPDGAARYGQGSVALGHQLLRTTPEATFDGQPLVSEKGGLVLVADVRLDNREELGHWFDLTQQDLAQTPDSALVMRAYERWGSDCASRLVGDFALALWDEPQRRLFCARDIMGVKPFYYYHKPGQCFVFASEIKALLRLSEVPRRLQERRVAQFLDWSAPDKELTFYRHVLRLPPAHWMTVSADGVVQRAYWALDPEMEIREASDKDYAEGFRERFFQAVDSRLRASTPVGVQLSGGLDSSSVACTAEQLLQGTSEPLHTFSVVFPGLPEEDRKAIDERSYVEAVLASGRFEAHMIRGDELSPLHKVEQVLYHQDQPPTVGNMYMLWAQYEAAKAQGVRAVMDGMEGDDVISHGYGYLGELASLGKWEAFEEEVRALSARQAADGGSFSVNNALYSMGLPFLPDRIHRSGYRAFWRDVQKLSSQFGLSRRWLLWQYGAKTMMPEPVRRAWNRARVQRSDSETGLMDPTFARQVGWEEEQYQIGKGYRDHPRTRRFMHWLGLQAGETSARLESTDMVAAALGVEARHPFWDRHLMEYCLAMPADQIIRDGWTRYVMREAMRGVVPEKVRTRVWKAVLAPNVKHTLMRFEARRLRTLFQHHADRVEPYVDLTKLRELLTRLETAPSSRDVQLLWPALMLLLWLRQSELDD